jgi:hypothetical protein
MKQKKVSFKYKKQKIDLNVVVFDSIAEAHNMLGDELLKIINFGNEELARLTAIKVDPFRQKKTKYKLNSTKIDEKTLEMLMEAGALED